MNKLILITGGSGFVGSHLLQELKKKDYLLRIIIRENKCNIFSDFKNVESFIFSEDIFSENQEWWDNTCINVDIIIHLAWYTEHGKYLSSEKNLECLSGTLNLARSAVKASVKMFIGIGTCFEYKMSDELLTIETPLGPTTIYSACKASAFVTLQNYFNQARIKFAWCRIFYLYGEGEDPRRLVPYLRSKISKGEIANLSSGEQVKDYLNVSKAVKLILEVIKKEYSGPINICSGIGISVKDLAYKIADEYGRRDLVLFGNKVDNIIDPQYIVGKKLF